MDNKKYQICGRCVMDTAAADIKFDSGGYCNYCAEYLKVLSGLGSEPQDLKKKLSLLAGRIKKAGKNKDYDCAIGVSGGLDSSYALYYIVKELGLRPFAIHLDNGWNSELAVSNIENLCKNLGVDLYTYVIDWEEFRGLQRAYFKANVVDIEALTDHAISAILYKTAFSKGIKYIVTGVNVANEGMRMPPGWNYGHKLLDARNIKAIYRRFGSGGAIKTFPFMGIAENIWYRFFAGIKDVRVLDYTRYDKNEAISILTKEVHYRPYEKKHYESVFTRFYQGYILPVKFKVDKRKLHYSTLVCSRQMERREALDFIKGNPYDDLALLGQDKEYVLKKMGFTDKEFGEYMSTGGVLNSAYPSNEMLLKLLAFIAKIVKKLP